MKSLTYGELSTHPVSGFVFGDPESEVDPLKWAQVISHINLGLIDIYGQFHLGTKEIYVQMHEELEIYKIHSDFAVSNTASLEDPKYIIDTPEQPFLDDILKIEEIYDENGNLQPLNDFNDEDSFYTTEPTTIQVPYSNDTNSFAIQYRMGHYTIPDDLTINPADIELLHPTHFNEPLQLFVGARMFHSLGGDNVAQGDRMYNMYINKIRDIERLGLYVMPESSNAWFTRGGWV